jgi:hypothetical protein
MISEIEIVTVEREDPSGIIVTFSDGTIGAYVVEELLELRPHREPIRDSHANVRNIASSGRTFGKSSGNVDSSALHET